MAFLLLGERLGEAAGMKLKGIKQAAQQQPDICKHLLHLSTTLFSISHGYSDGDRPNSPWSSLSNRPGFGSDCFIGL